MEREREGGKEGWKKRGGQGMVSPKPKNQTSPMGIL